MLMRSLEQLGDEIAELSVHLDAATVRLLDVIREFDAREGWNNGFRSCAAWLAWRVGLDMGAARERVRVARALEALPRLKDALARGELSYAKVRALTRVATPATEDLAVGRAGHDGIRRLLDLAAHRLHQGPHPQPHLIRGHGHVLSGVHLLLQLALPRRGAARSKQESGRDGQGTIPSSAGRACPDVAQCGELDHGKRRVRDPVGAGGGAEPVSVPHAPCLALEPSVVVGLDVANRRASWLVPLVRPLPERHDGAKRPISS